MIQNVSRLLVILISTVKMNSWLPSLPISSAGSIPCFLGLVDPGSRDWRQIPRAMWILLGICHNRGVGRSLLSQEQELKILFWARIGFVCYHSIGMVRQPPSQSSENPLHNHTSTCVCACVVLWWYVVWWCIVCCPATGGPSWRQWNGSPPPHQIVAYRRWRRHQACLCQSSESHTWRTPMQCITSRQLTSHSCRLVNLCVAFWLMSGSGLSIHQRQHRCRRDLHPPQATTPSYTWPQPASKFLCASTWTRSRRLWCNAPLPSTSTPAAQHSRATAAAWSPTPRAPTALSTTHSCLWATAPTPMPLLIGRSVLFWRFILSACPNTYPHQQHLETWSLCALPYLALCPCFVLVSWRTGWGINGYVLIERSDDNLCNALYSAGYPVLWQCADLLSSLVWFTIFLDFFKLIFKLFSNFFFLQLHIEIQKWI